MSTHAHRLNRDEIETMCAYRSMSCLVMLTDMFRLLHVWECLFSHAHYRQKCIWNVVRWSRPLHTTSQHHWQAPWAQIKLILYRQSGLGPHCSSQMPLERSSWRQMQTILVPHYFDYLINVNNNRWRRRGGVMCPSWQISLKTACLILITGADAGHHAWD